MLDGIVSDLQHGSQASLIWWVKKIIEVSYKMRVFVGGYVLLLGCYSNNAFASIQHQQEMLRR